MIKWTFATRKKEILILGFRKANKEVFIHIFCNEFCNPIYAFQIVAGLYSKHNLGTPKFIPEELNWVHTIPLPGSTLTPEETMLIHQLTNSMFWTIFMKFPTKITKRPFLFSFNDLLKTACPL